MSSTSSSLLILALTSGARLDHRRIGSVRFEPKDLATDTDERCLAFGQNVFESIKYELGVLAVAQLADADVIESSIRL